MGMGRFALHVGNLKCNGVWPVPGKFDYLLLGYAIPILEILRVAPLRHSRLGFSSVIFEGFVLSG